MQINILIVIQALSNYRRVCKDTDLFGRST